ncbi:MAG: glycoside hydrolase family 32 protein, partial [Lentisphaerae bacterium]|nr:glycoside hydrolase family 32 protein [Lentisphaerota bacterium]
YRFILSRSKDLIHWEDAPEDRPLLLPDYNHRPDPVRFPEVFEISVSDMEYRELDGFVRAYYIGGNQWGICDNQVAEYHGSLRDFFHEFYR